ncbi:MAG: hypothetical protein EOP34_11220, partial [Rickettsiales bacterium]
MIKFYKFLLIIISSYSIQAEASLQKTSDQTIHLENIKCLNQRLLSLDGGGVRGIVTARILKEFEVRTGKAISQLFDLASGTSTGSLMILGLFTPDHDLRPKYSAEYFIELYKKLSKEIFEKEISRDIYTGFGLWGAKYDRKEFDKILENIFQDIKISQVIAPLFIPVYLLTEEKPIIISSELAKINKTEDFYIRDVAAAASSAPTYFAPKVFQNIDKTITHVGVDGGLYANDPVIITSLGLYESCHKINTNNTIFVSIGTGEVNKELSLSSG